MIRLDASSYIVAAIGILVPLVYALFVIFLTRRGREFSKMGGSRWPVYKPPFTARSLNRSKKRQPLSPRQIKRPNK